MQKAIAERTAATAFLDLRAGRKHVFADFQGISN
jgi:hypothetical protein